MPNIIREKSYAFSLKIISLYRELAEKKEFIVSKQLLRSGTSIGANIEEALAGQSRKDFHAKLTIAFKEAKETNYWLRLLRDSGLAGSNLSSHLQDSDELIRILNAITRKTKYPKVSAQLKASNS